MKTKRVIIGIIGLLILLPAIQIISAVQTNITVKTLPIHEVQLTTYDSAKADFSKFEGFRGYTFSDGKIKFVSEADKPFNIVIYIKNIEHQTVTSETFEEEFTPGEPIWIELYTNGSNVEVGEDALALINENNTEDINISSVVSNDINNSIESNNTNETTANSTVNSTETEIASESKIRFTIFEEDGTVKKVVYYSLGVLLIAIIIFVVLRVIKRSKMEEENGPKDIHVRKLSEVIAERKLSEEKNIELKRAEKRLQEIEGKIEQIKNKEKIDDIKKGIIEKEKELVELRKKQKEIERGRL
ncbi:MAG TPA: hypothetical protein VJH65_02540 [Candidatus Nanoarchaeia archaeon]|nr:hypothetical protein [Candidatus Nanoarchaeia archaeon]